MKSGGVWELAHDPSAQGVKVVFEHQVVLRLCAFCLLSMLHGEAEADGMHAQVLSGLLPLSQQGALLW